MTPSIEVDDERALVRGREIVMTWASCSRACVRVVSIVAVALAASATAFAQDGTESTPAVEQTKVVPTELNVDLRDLPPLSAMSAISMPRYRPLRRGPTSQKTLRPSDRFESAPAGPVGGPNLPMPSPIQSFPGMNFNDVCGAGQCGGGWPPDTVGDVGPNHYIQGVNVGYAIYNKTGTLLTSFTENQLWSTSGSNPCNGLSQGDPIVAYDRLADRWILTHFAFGDAGPPFFDPVSPFFQCVAVSKTGDPVTGGWWLYPLRMDPGGVNQPPVGAFNDYLKVGIWNDCVYMSANEYDEAQPNPSGNFLGIAALSLSRADLYAGAPLTWAIVYLTSPANDVFTLLPSHNLGSGVNAPAPGTPNYFVNESGVTFDFVVRKFTPGPNCGAGGSMSAAVNVPQTIYNYNVGEDVPQPNMAPNLDSLVDRLMQKAIYRKVNGVESVWVTHTVGDGPPLTKTGLQWAQINVTGGTISTTTVQQGIHWPDPIWRFMGSLAVDGRGNMALGYSTSGPTSPNFPSIKYAGRLAGDPLNTLPQTETTLIAGLGSQVNNCGGAPCHRWGDYSSMSVDPTDDCTFWYTNQYYSSQTTGNSGNWQTRIGSFKFPGCTAPLSGSTRTFVAVDGLDTNPCNATSPCRTLAHAISITTPGGEIQVLNSGGYGGLTIDRPITIAASKGVYAGVTVSSGDGITVNPGPSGPVILRGLTINSTGGNRGIVQQSGTALHVEDCVISNFAVVGIQAMPATTSSLYLRNSEVRGNQVGVSAGTTASGTYMLEIDRSTFAKNAQAGLDIATTGRGANGAIRNSVFTGNGFGVIMQPLAGTTAKLELRKTTFDTNNATALFVGSGGATTMANVASSTFANNLGAVGATNGATIHVADTTIIRNGVGLSPGTGTIVSFGNNRLLQNTTNGSFSSTISPQ